MALYSFLPVIILLCSASNQDVSADLVTIASNIASIGSAVNSALEAVKKGLHSVKVSKYDATKLERELQGELFDKWHEGCEVMKAKKVAFENMPAYLDHMQDTYEGIDASLRKKMNGIIFSEESWEYKIVEWKFNKGDNSGARYGMVAFGRSPDGKYVDCMYVMYKMDFKIAPKVIVTEEKHSKFWGLKKWTTTHVQHVERDLGMKSIKALQNFFRLKALQGFYKEGLIDSINYVSSLDEVPETPQQQNQKKEEL